jgi:nucleoside-diphosphate-sugar epimerase
MKLLVTGGCGYVGTRLTLAILERTEHEVHVLDVAWFGNHLPSHPRLTIHELDVRKIDDFELSPYDAVFHLANIANDPSVELNPYSSWEVNVLAGMRLIDRAQRQGVRHLLFASSGSVYGLKDELDVTEDLTLVPLSEYNKTKMVAERVVQSYAPRMVTTIVRPATVCGFSPRMRLDVVVNLLTIQALTKGVVTVLGGDQVRPNIHIDDLVDAYLFLFERRIEGVFNAGFENLTVLEIAKLVTEEVPARIEVRPSNDPRSYRMNSDRLLATGFRPTRSTSVAIREMVEAFRRGAIRDEDMCYNVRWMKERQIS